MSKTIIVSVLAAVLVAGQVQTAGAINKEWSAALGFLGGLMVANGGLCPRTTTVCEPVYVQRPVVYQEPVVVQQPVYVQQPVVVQEPVCPPPVIVEQPVVAGHYEYRTQQVWEPGQWICVPTRCGAVRRVWQPGFYRTETIQVWVDDFGGHHRGHRR